jgi:fructoselysine-6-P-deglycase FrlB-like protein
MQEDGEVAPYVIDEINTQPGCWQKAAQLAARYELLLPRRGQRVAVTGCGTSWFIAQSYAALREAAGHGITDAFAASEFPTDRAYDRTLLITRSGTTTEVLDLLRLLPGSTATTVITTVPSSPAATLARDAIALPFADERSIVQTRSATSALSLLRAHLGTQPPFADAEDALTTALPVPATTAQVTFLGAGWAAGLAQEAALKCREAANLWTEAYPAMEYRHGPIAVAEDGRAVWALGPLPEGLAEDIESTGATLVQSGRDPLAELLVAQRFAVAAAEARGLDPDRPRNLTRSVVLP